MVFCIVSHLGALKVVIKHNIINHFLKQSKDLGHTNVIFRFSIESLEREGDFFSCKFLFLLFSVFCIIHCDILFLLKNFSNNSVLFDWPSKNCKHFWHLLLRMSWGLCMHCRLVSALTSSPSFFGTSFRLSKATKLLRKLLFNFTQRIFLVLLY